MTTTTNAFSYSFLHASACYVNPFSGKDQVAIFTNFLIQEGDIVTNQFIPVENGPDLLIFTVISSTNSGIPIDNIAYYFPMQIGVDSKHVIIKILNSGNTILATTEIIYTEVLQRQPIDSAVIFYASANFGYNAFANGAPLNTSTAFMTVNLDTPAGLAVNKTETAEFGFIPGTTQAEPDTFTVFVTDDPAAPATRVCEVFGPFVLSNGSINGVQFQTIVKNGPPIKSVVGIKIYNDTEILSSIKKING